MIPIIRMIILMILLFPVIGTTILIQINLILLITDASNESDFDHLNTVIIFG